MPTIRQKKAFDKLVENGGKSVSRAMREAGYPPATAKNPSKVTESKGWKELMDEYLSDDKLAQKHDELLNSTTLDHMVFPLGPKNEKQREAWELERKTKAIKKGVEYEPADSLSDDDIKEMLAEINCKVRRVVHGETARHVYFWSADNRSRKDALDMAYKLKGSYAPEKTLVANFEVSDDKKEQTDKLLGGIIGDSEDSE